jgi:hypothetical protein
MGQSWSKAVDTLETEVRDKKDVLEKTSEFVLFGKAFSKMGFQI